MIKVLKARGAPLFGQDLAKPAGPQRIICLPLCASPPADAGGGFGKQLPMGYPKATSSAIISVKPAANSTVPMLEWGASDISGISSSTTT